MGMKVEDSMMRDVGEGDFEKRGANNNNWSNIKREDDDFNDIRNY